MRSRVRDSKAYLDRWIEQNGVERSDMARIQEGFEFSLQSDRIPVNELQRPEFYVPGLTASAWWDKEQFPWVSTVEQATSEIRSELEAIGGLSGDSGVKHPANLDDDGRWSAYYFYFVGRRYADHAQACPGTMQALSAVPGSDQSGMAYFSIMDPHTHVTPHSGFTNTHLRCHLGLEIPEGCRIRVGDEVRGWAAGQVNVFDDSFNHEVWNDSDSGRAVLLFDTWHPDLTRIEVEALAYLVNVWRKLIYRGLVAGAAQPAAV